jgi:signal transduction histidine kinase
LIRASRGERVDDMELVVRSAQGTDKRWYVVSGRPVCDRSGALRGGVIVCRDVTQKRQLERQLLQAQKLEAIGQLAAGIAHEINTPAQYVGDNVRFLSEGFTHVLNALGAYEMLSEQAKAAGVVSECVMRAEALVEAGDVGYLRNEIPKAIREALEGVRRIVDIVGAVKGFSHPGSHQMVSIDLNRQVEHTVSVSRNEWKYVAEVVTDLDPELPPVMCLAGEINQVILNLLVNAAHAISDVPTASDAPTVGQAMGTITITTRHVGEHVQITIRDTGIGIPEAIRDRIFDPFFTTKDVGRGTGQGLAIAHSVVVDKHGGTITFDTEMGRGTAFTLLLPLRPTTSLEAAA